MDRDKLILLNDVNLARMAQKDTHAEEILLRRVYPKLFHVAWSMSGNRQYADDIAQIAALEVLKSLDSFRGSGSLESWAGRIAYRVSGKILKKEWNQQKTHVPIEMLAPIEEEKITIQHDAEKSISRRRLYEMLTRKMEIIPQKRRIPLLLHLAHGYTVKEVAELMEVSPNTIKDRLRTAYQEFRSIMEEHPHLRSAILEEIS